MGTGRIEISLRGASGSEFGAVATVELLRADDAGEWFGSREFPLASNGKPSRLDVPGGLYGIRVLLPTGRYLEEQEQVGDGATAKVHFLDDSRPEAFDLTFETMPQIVEDFGAFIGPGDLTDDNLIRPPYVNLPAHRPRTREFQSAFSESLAGAVAGSSLARYRAVEEQDTWHVFGATSQDLDTSDWDAATVPTSASLRGHNVRRLWYVASTESGQDAVSVPFASASHVQIRVDNSRPLGVCARLHDETFGGLFECFERGRMSSAAKLLDAIEEQRGVIATRFDDPLVSCLSSYVRLAVNDGTEEPDADRAHPWQDAISDFAIIQAKRFLMGPSASREIHKHAFLAVRHAMMLGIPFFSVGLMHLRDVLEALRYLNSEVEGMVALVDEVAARADVRQPLTVLRVQRRALAKSQRTAASFG